MEETTTTTSAVMDAPATTSTETSVSTPTATTSTAPARPTSMLDALQKADAGTLAPQPNSSTPGQPAAPQGPIPFEDHKRILENARTKAQTEALRGLTPEQLTNMLQWFGRAHQDTSGFFVNGILESPQAVQIVERLIREMNTHATHGPALKSLTGKALANLRGKATPEAPQMRRLELSDGSIQEVPADWGKFWAYHEARLGQAFGEKVAPISSTLESLKAEHDAAAQEAQIDHFVTTTYDDAKTWPGMETPEARQAVAQALLSAQVDPNDPRAVTLALNAAYRQVIVPTLTAKAQSAYAASLKQKAVGAIETASTGTAAPLAKPKNVSELAKYMAALEAGRR